jgi:hypothetical protein
VLTAAAIYAGSVGIGILLARLIEATLLWGAP